MDPVDRAVEAVPAARADRAAELVAPLVDQAEVADSQIFRRKSRHGRPPEDLCS